MPESTPTQLQGPPPPPPLVAGLGVAAAVALAIVGWVALGSTIVSEASLFGGFMVLWYWAKVEHLALDRLPATVLGALVGIGVSWAMFHCATKYGAAGFGFGLALLFVAIYIDIVQVLPLFFNASTMLFSIVSAAPLIQLKIDWVELCLATVGGGVFFGAYVAALSAIAGKLARRTS